jgi:6-phosphogluconate dehydrogenase
MDVGTSGGVLGLERGYCLMVGGTKEVFARVEPVFATLAPGGTGASTASKGYLHCGDCGAGHFVKMVHNGIEYGLMAAYAEGFNILQHADAGLRTRDTDAETAPLSNPDHFKFQLDIGAVAELWRHGSIIGSSLLDLTANALAHDPQLENFAGRVADSGEGRWTLQAAIEEGVPAYVLSAALYSRFASRDRSEFADKLLSAMRLGFGGHQEGPHK